MLPLRLVLISGLILNGDRLIDGHAYNEAGWRAAARYMKEAIDESINPCEDFYGYACGRWDQIYGKKYTAEVVRAVDLAIDHLTKAIKSIGKSSPLYQRNLKIFYDQCVEATEDPNAVLRSIYPEIEEQIGPMPLLNPEQSSSASSSVANSTDLYQLIGKSQQYLNTSVFFFAVVESVPYGCNFHSAIALLPAKIDRNYRVDLSANLTRYLLNLTQSSEDTVLRRIAELAELESELLALMETTQDDERRFQGNVHDLTLIFNTSMQPYFESLLPPEVLNDWQSRNGSVLIRNIEYFKNISNLIANRDPSLLTDYAYWRIMRNYLSYYLDLGSYHGLDNTGHSLERQCIDYVLEYASAAAARLYVESYGSNIFDWRYDVDLIAYTVMASFRYVVYSSEWLSLEQKTSIMERLRAIHFSAGVPDWLSDDREVEARTPPFDSSRSTFENDLNMFKNRFFWSVYPVTRNGSLYRGDVSEPIFIPHASYSEQKLRLFFGTLLPPLYNYSYPLALKFSSVGTIISEQLMRAFDVDVITRSQSDQKQRRSQTDNIKKHLHEKQQCLPENFPEFTFCADDNKTCDGSTARDRSEDIEGLKVAYLAHSFLMQTVGAEPSLPGLIKYNADQMFFLGYARLLCGTDREMLELSLMNFPAFSKAFNCTQGSRFSPPKTCSLWSDFSKIL